MSKAGGSAAPQILSAFGQQRTTVDFGLRWFVSF
jgi:hypothetical protein